MLTNELVSANISMTKFNKNGHSEKVFPELESRGEESGYEIL